MGSLFAKTTSGTFILHNMNRPASSTLDTGLKKVYWKTSLMKAPGDGMGFWDCPSAKWEPWSRRREVETAAAGIEHGKQIRRRLWRHTSVRYCWTNKQTKHEVPHRWQWDRASTHHLGTNGRTGKCCAMPKPQKGNEKLRNNSRPRR